MFLLYCVAMRSLRDSWKKVQWTSVTFFWWGLYKQLRGENENYLAHIHVINEKKSQVTITLLFSDCLD